MALTTNTTVWKFMLVIFVILTVSFYVCFYFQDIFIIIVIGLALIVLTGKFRSDFDKHIAKYHLSAWKRKLFGTTLVFFWLAVIYHTLATSFAEMGGAMSMLGNESETVALSYFNMIEPFLPEIVIENVINEQTLEKAQNFIIGFLADILLKIPSFVFRGMLIIPLLFYMYFKRKERITQQITSLVPEKFKVPFQRATEEVGDQLGEFFEAKVVETTVIGAICCLGFFIAGVKGWLFLGILAGFLNVVPFIGPIIGAIPALLLALADEPIVALYVLVTVLIAQAVDNFYLIPFMISGKVRIDPLLSIVLALMGAQLFGVIGMIFAIPVYIVYKVVLKQVYGQLIQIYGEE